MTPWENLRRFVVGSPPWIIFMLSLAIMAVGVLVLAYRLRVDPDYGKDRALSSLHLCYIPTTEAKSDKQKTVSLPQFNVSVPVTVRVPQSFVAFLNKSNDLAIGVGQFYSGQLGLKGTSGHGHNWTLVVPLRMSGTCEDQRCKEEVYHTCLTLSAEDATSLPSILTEESCGTNTSGAIYSAKNLRVLQMANIRDESRSTPAPGPSFCSKGFLVRMHLDEREQFVLIPLVHDTMAARLHLLYTSYFLFTTLIFLLCYAMCKGHNFHKSARHLSAEVSMVNSAPYFARIHLFRID